MFGHLAVGVFLVAELRVTEDHARRKQLDEQAQRAVSSDDSPRLLGAVLWSLADLIEGGWDRCLPSSPGRRQDAMKWLDEQLAGNQAYPGPLAVYVPQPKEAAAVLGCLAAATRIGNACQKAFNLSSLSQVRDRLSARKKMRRRR